MNTSVLREWANYWGVTEMWSTGLQSDKMYSYASEYVVTTRAPAVEMVVSETSLNWIAGMSDPTLTEYVRSRHINPQVFKEWVKHQDDLERAREAHPAVEDAYRKFLTVVALCQK